MPALPTIATASIAGTFAGAIFGGVWWPTVLIAALAFFAVAIWSRSRISMLVLLATVAFAAAGHARFETTTSGTSSSPLATLKGPHEVVGTIREQPHLRGITARVDLTVERIDRQPASGGLRLTLPAPSDPIEVGDRLMFAGEIERPPEIEEFDYAAYLRSRGIDAVAAYPERWAVLGHNDGPWLTEKTRKLRDWSIANIERVLPEPEASLVIGLLIGAQRTMPDDLTEDLRATGTTHLVVVSGQNVALVLGTAVALLAAFVARRRAALLALILLPAYVVLAGAEPPVVRAALMAVGLSVAEVSGRRTPAWIFLTYTAAIMLAIDPLLANDMSFQLSLAATVGVLLIAPPLRDALLVRLSLTNGGMAASTVEVTAVSIGAALAVLPVQVAAFGAFPLMQVPANIIVAPLYEATLLASILAVALGAIGPLAEPMGIVLQSIPATFIGTVHVLSGFPKTVIEVQAPLTASIVWYALLTIGLWWLSRQEPPALSPSTRSGLAPTFMLAIATGGLWVAALTPTDNLASVTVLDVGQGLAVLVRDGDNAILVDTGPPDGAIIAALSRTGQRSRLDAVILTHEDADHAGGLSTLMRRYDVAHVLAAPDSGVERSQRLDIGDRVRLSARTTIEVLSPPVVTGGARARVGQRPGAGAAGDGRRPSHPPPGRHRGECRALACRKRTRHPRGCSRSPASRLTDIVDA